jgi:hypothetical protein
VGEVDAGAPGERGAEITGWFVAWRLPMGGRRWGEGVEGRSDEGLKRAEDARDVLIAVGDGLLGKVLQRARVCEREDMCRAVIPLQRFGHGVLMGLHAIITRRGQEWGSAFSRHHGAATAHAGHPGPITHHVVEGRCL